MAQRKMSRTARPGPTSGGWSQMRKRTEWLVRLEDGGQEDGVPVWQGQLDQGEKTDLGRGPVVAFSIIIITMYLELLDHCAFF